MARDYPEEHAWIDKNEKKYILENRILKTKTEVINVPWGQIMISKPVLACVIANMTHLWYINTSFVQMPRF